MEPKYKLGSFNLTSSGPVEDVAVTIKGIATSLVGLVAVLISVFDLPFTIEQYTAQIGNLSITIGTIIAGYGFIMKLIRKYTATR